MIYGGEGGSRIERRMGRRIFECTRSVVGFKGNVQLDEDWYVPFYYDVGKGDSELTYQAFAGINYSFSSF